MTAVVPPVTSRRRATGTFRPPVRTGVRAVGTGLSRALLALQVEGAENGRAAGWG